MFNQAQKLHEGFLELQEKQMPLASELNIFMKKRSKSSYVVNSLLTRINKGNQLESALFKYLSS